MGCYNGVVWKRQRLCDALVSNRRSFAYFAYVGGVATGDHFLTLAEFRAWVDRNFAGGYTWGDV